MKSEHPEDPRAKCCGAGGAERKKGYPVDAIWYESLEKLKREGKKKGRKRKTIFERRVSRKISTAKLTGASRFRKDFADLEKVYEYKN